MASPPANQFSVGNLDAPKQQRRMTSPAESFTSLSLPAGALRTTARPPSPLRHGFVMDTGTGIDPSRDSEGSDEEEGEENANWQRSPSPASSVSNLAASFVQRMNNFVGGIAPKSSGTMLSDAELEAEAERERDRSRREAEAILTREAQQRKLVEERVLAMMESTKSLPLPPSRSQTMPSTPSPPPQKEPSWWSAAKQRLTPTKDKEPLTPAQQIVHETKAREKDKKGGKGNEKEQTKPSDNGLGNLNIPVPPPTRKPVPSSPSSPTPSRPSLSNMPPNLTPSPMRTIDSLSSSPSREAPPLYAQFNAQGTLDVAGTLITIAKRFEKLEKWTVGHVRALEERMNDVERWLVDKEKEKAETESMKEEPAKSLSTEVHQNLQEIREEVTELQGRVGELGREMAKMATAPSNPTPVPKAQTTSFSATPLPSSSALVQDYTETSPSTPHHGRLTSSSAVDSTSPPLNSTKTPSGTRLPYPQGDYTSPPDTFSPPSSPRGSLDNSARPSRISGLPPSSAPYLSSYSSNSSLSSNRARAMSPPNQLTNVARTTSPSPLGGGLPPPKAVNQRQSSVSPTPRKRYTVALGGPIVAPEPSSNAADASGSTRVRTPKPFHKALALYDDDEDDDDEESRDGDDTIGKSAATKLMGSATFAGGAGAGDYKPFTSATIPSSISARSSSPSPMSNRRLRAQSAYGYSSIAGSSSTTTTVTPTVAPLKPKLRSKSSERLNPPSSGSSSDGMINSLGSGNKFVDPLVLRKQSRESMKPIAMPRPMGKVPIGQLVAFFDRDKKP